MLDVESNTFTDNWEAESIAPYIGVAEVAEGLGVPEHVLHAWKSKAKERK